MRYLLAIILIVALVALIFMLIKLIQFNPSKQLKKNLHSIFKELEREYENLVTQKIDFEIIKNENLNINIDEIVRSIEPLLKPQIEALFAIVSSNTLDNKTLGQIKDIKYFKNLYFVAQRLLMEKLPLTRLEKEELFQALTDAIKADISKRVMQLQTGI